MLETKNAPLNSKLPGEYSDDGVFYEYTIDAAQLKSERDSGVPEFGRESIGRDTPIDGGVYWGTYGGEAIVVDSEKYPEGINRALQQVNELITRPNGTIDKSKVFSAVYSTVCNTMRYDHKAVERILEEAGGLDYTKIALESYIKQGVGVCRHQALFAGQILEKLAGQGKINGHISVDRNAVRRSDDIDDKYDGHAWVRYANSQGDVYIIDPAQHVVGELDSLIEARDNGENYWEYARPEDRERMRHKKVETGLGSTAILNLHDGRDMGYNDKGIIDHLPAWLFEDNPVH